MIPKTEIIPGESYQRYLDLVSEEDINKALTRNTRQFRKLLESIPRKKVDHAYAPGKWTVREMLQHIVDCERVFAYRGLHLSRMDAKPLPGFEENDWAANSGGDDRRWKDLIEEFAAVRRATEYLYDSLSDEQLRFVGQVNGRPQNAFTVGFIIPGHVYHHMQILKERYL